MTRPAAPAIDHYENFPVASWLCPPALRPAVAALYHYARTADDLADEGEATPWQRRESLAAYAAALEHCLQVAQAAPIVPASSDAADVAQASRWPQVFAPLAGAIRAHDLPAQPLRDLLSAFVQDIEAPPYPDRASLLDYCRRSANPVGRLMLRLMRQEDPRSLAESDAICTGLQLVNFWQDLSVDLARGRHYVPISDAQAHGLSLDDLVRLRAGGDDTPASRALVRTLCGWAGECLHRGAPLARRVPGRMGWELRLVVQGGLRVLEKIAGMDYRSLVQRPVLGRVDLMHCAWGAWRMREPSPNTRSPRRTAG